MGSEALLEGKCVIWKNKTQIQSFQGAFTFDDDLRRFKSWGTELWLLRSAPSRSRT